MAVSFTKDSEKRPLQGGAATRTRHGPVNGAPRAEKDGIVFQFSSIRCDTPPEELRGVG
jgi:hypothetical protein